MRECMGVVTTCDRVIAVQTRLGLEPGLGPGLNYLVSLELGCVLSLQDHSRSNHRPPRLCF